MFPKFQYDSSLSKQQQQQFQSTQWIYQPSFYNGYTTGAPTILSQPTTVVQTYLPPARHQYPVDNYSPPIISSSYPSSMKTYDRLRNAFSCSNHQDSNNADDDYLYHEQQLNRNLAKNGIERIPVKGDGNCLFYALAEGLTHEMNVDPYEFGLQLRRLCRLPANFRIVDLADCLRQLCVDQWRLYEDYYSQFVDKEKVSFLKEVKKFSKSGVSDSTLGDIVPLTIANALNVNITIFTSVSNLPRIDVKPERKANLLSTTQKRIYLAYNQSGIGHYDAAYPRN